MDPFKRRRVVQGSLILVLILVLTRIPISNSNPTLLFLLDPFLFAFLSFLTVKAPKNKMKKEVKDA